MGRTIEEVIGELKVRLPLYLGSHGRKPDSSGKFKCPNAQAGHKNGDQTPSASIVPGTNDEVWHCFSENISGTIFHAAHYIEGLPIEGNPFFSVTIPKLCNEFGIALPSQEELTPEEKEKYQLYRIYQDIYNILKNNTDYKQLEAWVNSRGWDTEFAKREGIFAGIGINPLVEKLQNIGWSKQVIIKSGISDTVDSSASRLYSLKSLIFTIRDDNGGIVGFSARDMEWTPGNKNKYVNSINNVIYQKNKTLYNFHDARKRNSTIYIVEGYADACTMKYKGILNVAAIGGTAFTEGHLDVLIKHKIARFILCMDGDEAGKKTSNEVIKTYGERSTAIQVEVLELPEREDPDSYLRSRTVEDFKKRRTISPFEYKLKNTEWDANLSELAKDMVPLVLAEQSPIRRDEMIKSLSRQTNVGVNVLRAELEQLENQEKYKYALESSKIGHRLMAVLKSGDDPTLAILEASEEVRQLQNSWVGSGDEVEEYTKDLLDIKDYNDAKGLELSGFHCEPFMSLQEAFDGIPKEGYVIALGGRPNCGKTSWLQSLGWYMANKNNNCLVLFMSIDDSRKKIMPSTVAIDQCLELKQVYHPKRFINTPEDTSKYNEGWRRLQELSDRFVVKDVRHGNTVEALRRHIKVYKRRYPDKKIVVILDNFHKLGGNSSGKDGIRGSHYANSNRIKELATVEDVPIIMSVELRKLPVDRKPTLEDLAESVRLEFDTDAVLLMHNDYHCLPDTSAFYWTTILDNVVKKAPIIEVQIAKNKISDSKERLWYKLDPYRRQFTDMTQAEIDELIARSKETKKYANGDPGQGSFKFRG